MIIKFIFLVLFSQTIFNSDVFAQKKQFIYNDSTLQIIFATNKSDIKLHDSVSLKIKYVNVSNDTVLILNYLYKQFTYGKSGKILDIYNGSDFTPGAESREELKYLLPLDTLKKEIYITSENLISNGVENKFNIYFGLGYIKSFDILYRNNFLSNKEIEIGDNQSVYASSMVIFGSLTIKGFKIFQLNFDK